MYHRGVEISASARIVGCLVGGAVGDALGASVEFDSYEAIVQKHGAAGIVDPAPAYGHPCPITDDTQMTLFTAEGLLRAAVAGAADPTVAIHRAYLRWLHTQGCRSEHPDFDDALDGWLVREPGLHSARAPGNTCIGGLTRPRMGTPDAPLNDSKGCGGVMRIAPIGLVCAQPGPLAARACALSHGHPSGWRAGYALAEILGRQMRGESVREAACAVVDDPTIEGEVADALRAAIELGVRTRPPTVAAVASLGEGWVAEEALAIAVYCVLASDDLATAVRAAVNHGGDSDSTGSIAGQLAGAQWGERAIPRAWRDALELREVVQTLAQDLFSLRSDVTPTSRRYPAG